MNSLIPSNYTEVLDTLDTQNGGVIQNLLNAVPTAVAKPFLDAQRNKMYKDLCSQAIAANAASRADLMLTLRTLAENQQLTPELIQYLFATYNQHLISI